MQIKIQDIHPRMVGQTINGLLIIRVNDGTAETVSDFIWRYRIPVEGGGYVKHMDQDGNERIVIIEAPAPIMGNFEYGGKRVGGLEFIENVPRDYDKELFHKTGVMKNADCHVWWYEGHTIMPLVIARHPLTKEPTLVDNKIVGGTGHYGTFQEFVDAVNAADPDVVIPPPPNPPGSLGSALTCKATTAAGNPCKGKPVADSDYCMAHQGQG